MSPISIIGVVSGTTAEPPTFTDWAYGDDRPLMAQGSYSFAVGDYYIWKNFRHTGSNFWMTQFVNACIVENSKFTKTAVGSALDIYSNNRIINCEVQSIGNCIRMQANNRIIGSYFHDSAQGLNLDFSNANTILFNVFDTITNEGIAGSTRNSITVMNNTFYNCGEGIEATTGYAWIIMNNIFSDCTTGIIWSTETKSNYIDYNNFWGNTTDVSGVTKGVHATAHEPRFVDAAGGDFRLQRKSGCKGSALSILLGVS